MRMDESGIAVVVFAGVHFALVLFGIVWTVRNGITPFWLLFPIAITLSCSCIASIPYWDNWEESLTNWTMVGAWGFIVTNFVFFLCAAFELDAFIGVKRDILGRALSRTAGKVYRQGKRKAEREEQNEQRLREILLTSENALPVVPGDIYNSETYSIANGVTSERRESQLDIMRQTMIEEENGATTYRHSNVSLGGNITSSARMRPHRPSLGARSNTNSMNDDSSQSDQHPHGIGDHRAPGGDEENISRSERDRKPLLITPKEEGLDLIAHVLPKKVFGISTEQNFDAETLRWLGMGGDIPAYVHRYKNRKCVQATVYYLLSVAALAGMAVMEQVASGKVVGWLNVGWIILGDSILLLRLLQPPTTHRERKQQFMTFTSSSTSSSSALGEKGKGWIAQIPNESRVPRLWMLALVLFLCRAVLVTVPLSFTFTAQCVAFVFCASYLSIYIIGELHKNKTPKLPFFLLVLFVLWLIMDTVVIAMSTVSEDVAEFFGGRREFDWEKHKPVEEWILGLGSVSIVVSIAAIHYAIWYAKGKRQKIVWVCVYVLFCLTAVALDFIASGRMDLELGIFVTVALLFPYVGLSILSLRECFVSKTRDLKSKRLIGSLSLALGFAVAWSFALNAVNNDEVSFLIFVIPCEIHCIVCFLCWLALVYNCVEMDYGGWFALGMSLLCYIATLPIAFGSLTVEDSKDSNIWSNQYLGVAIVTFLLIPVVLLWAMCSLQLVDMGWAFVFRLPCSSTHRNGSSSSATQARRLIRRRIMFQLMMLVMGACVLVSTVLTGFLFGPAPAVWLMTVLLLFFFITSAIQVRVLQRPFSRTEINIRVVTLSLVAFILFVLSLVDSQVVFIVPGAPKMHDEDDNSWTHYLLAGGLLFSFACLDYVSSMFNSVPNEIISPSENLFGFPIVRYVIERKGGEIYVYNNQIYICCICFLALDVVGFIVALSPSTTDEAKNWGLVLSCAAFCLIALLGMHMRQFRNSQFRRDLSQVNLTSPLAEEAFAKVLKDTVGKIRQFSTRTTLFPSPPTSGKSIHSTEEKQKSLAFFYLLFSLSSKRKIRLAKQANAIAIQKLRVRDEQDRLLYQQQQQQRLQQQPQSQQEQDLGFKVSIDGGDSTTMGEDSLTMTTTTSAAGGDGGGRGAMSLSTTSSSRLGEHQSGRNGRKHSNEQDEADDDIESQQRMATMGDDTSHHSPGLDSPPPKESSRWSSTNLGGPPIQLNNKAERDAIPSQTNDDPHAMKTIASSKRSRTRFALTATATTNNRKTFSKLTESPEEHQEQPLEVREEDMYFDLEFPPNNSAVFPDWDSDLESTLSEFVQDEDEFCVWLRPGEISRNKPWGLLRPNEDALMKKTLGATITASASSTFMSSASSTSLKTESFPQVDPRQVKQGNVADCWLLSALSVVALKRDLFARVFPLTSKHPQGKYCVRLFDFRSGSWVDVVVDDRLPCDPETREPMFASSRSGQVFWVSIIEKAFAKRLGGWVNLNEGQVHRALVDLTGGFSLLYSCSDDFELVESGALWAKIFSLARAGDLLVLGSNSDADLFGLVKDHAYAVLSVVEVHDSRGKHRLVQLQDPWGKSDWKGAWSDSDKKSWTPRATWSVKQQQAELMSLSSPTTSFVAGNHHQSEGDSSSSSSMTSEGTFWMEFEDVLMNFQWLFTCRLFASEEGWIHHDVMGEWNRRTSGGPPNQPKTKHNPQFKLTLLGETNSNNDNTRNARASMDHSVVGGLMGCSPTSTTTRSGGVKEWAKRSGGVKEWAKRRKRRAVVFISICNLADLPVYPYMSLLVLNLEGRPVKGAVVGSQVVASTGKFKDARELSIEVLLPVGKTFTLLPTLNRIGDFGSFRLSCHAKVPFELSPF